MLDFEGQAVFINGSDLPSWLPWTNQAEGPKGLVLDVRGDRPDIRMTALEVTHETVYQALYVELPALYAETFAYLLRPGLNHQP